MNGILFDSLMFLYQPLYGFKASDHLPFRYASGGGRELFFTEEKEMDLTELVSGAPVKLPLDVHLRGKALPQHIPIYVDNISCWHFVQGKYLCLLINM